LLTSRQQGTASTIREETEKPDTDKPWWKPMDQELSQELAIKTDGKVHL
jgi:hypothetical protein